MKNPFRDCPDPVQFVMLPTPVCKLPRFCKVSGHALVLEHTATGYDTCTGAPTFSHWLHCPDWTDRNYKHTYGGGLWAREVNESATDFVSKPNPYSSYYFADYLDCTPDALNSVRAPEAAPARKPKAPK